MFQALTGLDLQNQVLNVEPVRPSLRVPHPIPDGLERLVLQCVSKHPADRPASAGALLEALETLGDVPGWGQQEAHAWWARNLPGLFSESRRPSTQ
jgi:serine/threonine-protein kinase